MNRRQCLSIAVALLFPCQWIPNHSVAADVPKVHSDSTVTFRIKAPKADKVLLIGDWLKRAEQIEMKKGDDGVWTATVGPFPVGRHIYEFNVDGVLMADPVNPAIKLRSARSGSFVHIPGEAIWEARDVPHGAVEINYLNSSVLGDLRATHIYTPPGYAKNSDRRYPVLYLLHGSNDTAAGWTMAGAANFILDNLIAEGKAKEMVVVMPYGHAVPFGSPRDIQATNTQRFEEYLLKDVMPMVESKYRIRQGSTNRAIVGLSMGGGQAISIGFKNLNTFDAIGAFSASVPNDFSDQFANVIASPEKVNQQLSQLWIGCGKDDSAVQRSQDFGKLLSEKGINHTLRITDGVHNFETWRRFLVELTPLLFRRNSELKSN